jgi:Ribosomal protein L7/L12 C-terminal domain
MSREDRIVRLERMVDYLFHRLEIDPNAAFATEFMMGGDGLPYSFHEALARGKKIEAIKIYRAVTGASLKDAKHAVDAMGRR